MFPLFLMLALQASSVNILIVCPEEGEKENPAQTYFYAWRGFGHRVSQNSDSFAVLIATLGPCGDERI
jgi:hypothetical protein